MQAAERIFEGEFADVMDDDDAPNASRGAAATEQRARMIVSSLPR